MRAEHKRERRKIGRASSRSKSVALNVYLNRSSKVVLIKYDWDDEDLLKELSKAYDELRGWSRRFLSLSVARYALSVIRISTFPHPIIESL